jgi:hypothetical protein
MEGQTLKRYEKGMASVQSLKSRLEEAELHHGGVWTCLHKEVKLKTRVDSLSSKAATFPGVHHMMGGITFARKGKQRLEWGHSCQCWGMGESEELRQ